MDPAALLLSVNALCDAIDSLRQSYTPTPGILSLIQSQLKSLETILELIQQWQAYADPQSEAHVLPGLRESWKTIGRCLERFQEDLDECPGLTGTPNGNSTESKQVQSESLFNETGLQRRLVDTQQCVALTHFCLSVCQL
jgi:hypothetical protein